MREGLDNEDLSDVNGDELSRRRAERKVKTDVVVQGVAKMDDIAYDQERDALAKELGVRVSTLDASRKKERKESSEDDAPILVLNTPEPCADSVDGVELLKVLVATFKEYLVLPGSVMAIGV